MKKLLVAFLLFAPVAFAQQPVTGTKTNNAAAPGGTNLGTLPCLANASAPSWTEGRLVLCSTDLAGNQRVLLITGSTTAVTQTTSPWIVAGGGTAGTATSGVVTVQGIASMTPVQVSQATAGNLNATVIGTGTFATQSAITAALGAIADGANVTLGAKADAKSTATDTTAITIMQVLKEISAMEQAPASRAVTNAGTFATQSAITAASGSFSSGAIASGAVASGAIASGAIASGACAAGCIADGGDTTLGAKADAKSTATDTTAITVMQVLKEISAMAQSPAALPANQSVNVAQINGVTTLMGNGVTGTGSQRVTIASDNTAFSVNATLSAETTKVIGTVNQGTSPWVVSANGGTFAVTQSGNWTNRIVGNAGATLDSTVGAGTAPTDQLVVGALYNSTEISPTTGQAFALQADAKGRLRNVIMDAAGNTRGANVDANNNLGVVLATETTKVIGTVNIIGGQTSITAGAGAVAANTPRTTLASDDPAVTALQLIDNPVGSLAGGTAGTSSYLSGCVNSTTLPILTAAQQVALQCDGSGRVLTNDVYGAALLASLSTLTAVTQRQRLYGTFSIPIGSVGDALKTTVTNVPPTGDPCTYGRKKTVAISQTASTQLVTSPAGQVWICFAKVVAGAAEIVSFVEGTGTTCGTGTAAISGSTTAANGESYAANGGFTEGNGMGTVMNSATPGNNVCLSQSGSNRVSGNITYVVSY